jgi:uncharacterized protein YdiU (UPF0061 family)
VLGADLKITELISARPADIVRQCANTNIHTVSFTTPCWQATILPMNKPLNLKTLQFDTTFIDALPGDPILDNYTRQVGRACYSLVKPRAFPNASLIAVSRELVQELGLDTAYCQSTDFLNLFNGTELPDTIQSYALCYGGHQFGHWAGQLGDGRAINLGEMIGPDNRHWTLQLKGAGPTPYSRTADGLAVLRSSIREFLCSEAMHHLGIPTTRALCLLNSGEKVMRDMFYDGHPRYEPGAIVCRVAPTFIRFGNFEIFTSRQDIETLRYLADFTIRRDFPELTPGGPETYLAWFRNICLSTADLMIHWMRVGFVHGVMNTDNMSITGLTIDYGPYGWLDNYDPDWTPNTTDASARRYRFGNQPMIALWNLVQLANALYPLVEQTQPFEDILQEYKTHYEKGWLAMMKAKLGLSDAHDDDEALIHALLQAFTLAETDMTLFFRKLADIDSLTTPHEAIAIMQEAFYAPLTSGEAEDAFLQWFFRYQQRLEKETRPTSERVSSMNSVNPIYVLRNYLAQQAIDLAEQEDYSMIHELMAVLRSPYTHQDGKEHLSGKRPDWARTKPGCSMLSCSS